MPLVALNDTELFYKDVGAGLPCLVMHGGLGLDHTYLHPWLDPLGDRLHLVYYDQRGHGRSGRPPLDSLTFAQLTADADALRAHLGFERVALLGHSYGGFLALAYALQYPQRLSHLILVDTAPAMDYGEEIAANRVRKGWTPALEAARQALPDDEAGTLARWRLIAPLYFHHYDAGLVERLLGETVRNSAASQRGDELLAGYNLVPRLAELAVPTLVLVGEDDFICPPSQARRLQAGIAGAELAVFEHSGHFPYIEEPDAFFTAIRGWLARTS